MITFWKDWRTSTTRHWLSFVYFFLCVLFFFSTSFFQQAGETSFNRGMLLNIGFKEALRFNNYKCFIFHDVDLMPESDRNKYSCPSSPRHLSVAVDTFNYRQVHLDKCVCKCSVQSQEAGVVVGGGGRDYGSRSIHNTNWDWRLLRGH